MKVIQRMVNKLPDPGPVSARGEGPEPGPSVAEPRARGSIPGLARRAGLHKQGSAPAVHRTRLACSYFDHDGVPTGLSVDGENQGAREFGVGRPELGW